MPALEARRKKHMMLVTTESDIDAGLGETCGNEEDDEEDYDDHHQVESVTTTPSASQQPRPLELSKSPKHFFLKPKVAASEQGTPTLQGAEAVQHSTPFSAVEFMTTTGGQKILSPSGLNSEFPSFSYQDADDQEVSAISEHPAGVPIPGSGNGNDDNVKTFCTEGTPRETPFLGGANDDDDDEAIEPLPSGQNMFRRIPDAASGLASGMETPAKVFCTEDTPGIHSPADSEEASFAVEEEDEAVVDADEAIANMDMVEDLNQRDGSDGGEEKGQREENLSEKASEQGAVASSVSTASTAVAASATSGQRMLHHQAKAVTFNSDMTPMMFSRASSIASLDSFEQQSCKDGYSSCDFSRATSGRVSPSDLPDSPCQTPPAERELAALVRSRRQARQQQQEERKPIGTSTANEASLAAAAVVEEEEAAAKPLEAVNANASFDDTNDDGDEAKTFEEEGTPGGAHSEATSLSKLTIEGDDDSKVVDTSSN